MPSLKISRFEYGERALLGKIKALVIRKKYDDAKKDLGKFDQMFPKSDHQDDIESLKKEIETKPQIGKRAPLKNVTSKIRSSK